MSREKKMCEEKCSGATRWVGGPGWRWWQDGVVDRYDVAGGGVGRGLSSQIRGMLILVPYTRFHRLGMGENLTVLHAFCSAIRERRQKIFDPFNPIMGWVWGGRGGV